MPHFRHKYLWIRPSEQLYWWVNVKYCINLYTRDALHQELLLHIKLTFTLFSRSPKQSQFLIFETLKVAQIVTFVMHFHKILFPMWENCCCAVLVRLQGSFEEYESQNLVVCRETAVFADMWWCETCLLPVHTCLIGEQSGEDGPAGHWGRC